MNGRSVPRRGPAPVTLTVAGHAVEVPPIRVVVVPPAGRVVEAPLGVEPLIVGAGEECDLVVVDPRVSRRHCELRFGAHGVVVRDLGSKNGTFAAALRIVEAELPPGLEIALGDSRLLLRLGDGPSRTIPLSTEARFGEALGGSVEMRALFATLERAAPTAETVLLTGESGTGKELLAKGIHQASPRRGGPWVVLDCTQIPEGMAEGYVFGWERGAFTGAQRARPGFFEEANGGTLFIDEIGEMPLHVQPLLLRALEDRRVRRLGSSRWVDVNVRLVAATHRDIRARVTEGSFRRDLYYRLAVVEARIPPLRDRKDDIPLIVERMLAARDPPLMIESLPPLGMALLMAHDWPGNVRELRNVVTRLLLFPYLGARAIPAVAIEGEQAGDARRRSLSHLPLREARELALEELEREYLVDHLRAAGRSMTRAARAMGVSRQYAHQLARRYGICVRDV